MTGTMPHAIGTARVPRRLVGEPRLRQALERWLAEADPARHGLPADAIVLVRRVATHWNTVQAADRAARYAPLGALLAGARRAASADDDADVVWFADEAELLACLARDALAGLLLQRWWWRALAQPHRGHDGGMASAPQQHALMRWLQAPQQVPRALQRLGGLRAQAWLTSLGADGQRHLIESLAMAYALADEVAAWVADGLVPPTAAELLRSTAQTGGATASARVAGAAERMLGLCASLQADAASVASASGLRQLALRLESESPAATDRALVQSPSLQAGTDDAPAKGTAGMAAAGTPPHQRTPAAPAAAAPRQARAEGAATVPLRGDGDSAAPHAADTASPPHARTAQHPRAAAPALTIPAPPQAWSLDNDDALPQLIHTRHGGLLFLLNAALALGLYGDFTQPRHRGLACPPWRLLLLAGRAWGGPGLRRDAALKRWLRQRSGNGSREPVPLSLWPSLHARLAQALADDADGDGHAAIPARTRIRRMLALPARLQDRGDRLDVFYPLAELPLAVRLAGLDRDPGWIPAAGCDVRFHFD